MNVLKRNLIPRSVQLGDLVGQLVDAILQGVGPPGQEHGLPVQLPKDILCMFAQVAQLTDDAGQRVVGDALQLILDLRADVHSADQDRLDLTLDQRHRGSVISLLTIK